MNRLIPTVALLLVASARSLSAQVPDDALQFADVVALARLSADEATKADLVRSSCVTFPVDAATEAQLRAAGASPTLVIAVGDACFAGAEMLVESQPVGAEVMVDNVRVGVTPWRGRFEPSRPMQVSVRSDGRMLSASASVEPRQRVRVEFAFAEDTVLVPGVRSVGQIARELDLENRWRPLSPEPRRPGAGPSLYTGGLVAWAAALGGAYVGARRCAAAENDCWLKPEIEEDGTDSVEPFRYLMGGTAGLVVSLTAHGILQRIVNVGVRASHRHSVHRHSEWSGANDLSRTEWIRNHPDLLDARQDDANARQRAEAHNAEVRERNRSVVPTRVTAEGL